MEQGKAAKWYDYGKIDMKSRFYEVEWIKIREEKDIDHSTFPDSRLFCKIGWLSLIFFPFAIIALVAGIKTIRIEGKNKWNRTAIILGILVILITLGWIVPLSIFSTGQLGIPI